MSQITTILAVVLMGLVFQKNPFVGIAVLIFYIYFKYKKSRFYYNKLVIESGKSKALMVKKSIDDGFEKVCETMEKFQGSTKDTQGDFTESLEPNKVPIDSGIYKN